MRSESAILQRRNLGPELRQGQCPWHAARTCTSGRGRLCAPVSAPARLCAAVASDDVVSNVTGLESGQTVGGGTIETTYHVKDSSFDPFGSGSVSPTTRGRVHVAWGHDRRGPLRPAHTRERVGTDRKRRVVICENIF